LVGAASAAGQTSVAPYRFLVGAESEDKIALVEFRPCASGQAAPACGVAVVRNYDVGLAPATRRNGIVLPGSTPPRAAGYAHIIDFTDPKHPEEVARYEVPEAGSHNFWIEADRLYASFYNGGLRIVDLSGELKGNLYYQGREIAAYLPLDPKGLIASAPFSTQPQLFKGNIFLADVFTGIWAVKLEPRTSPVP
jgi:hypothetical protein